MNETDQIQCRIRDILIWNSVQAFLVRKAYTMSRLKLNALWVQFFFLINCLYIGKVTGSTVSDRQHTAFIFEKIRHIPRNLQIISHTRSQNPNRIRTSTIEKIQDARIGAAPLVADRLQWCRLSD